MSSDSESRSLPSVPIQINNFLTEPEVNFDTIKQHLADAQLRGRQTPTDFALLSLPIQNGSFVTIHGIRMPGWGIGGRMPSAGHIHAKRMIVVLPSLTLRTGMPESKIPARMPFGNAAFNFFSHSF
jgi:hypothetical protein